jgi:hypothetical protein
MPAANLTITTVGQSVIAAAIQAGTSVVLSKVGLGETFSAPSVSATAVAGEVKRPAITDSNVTGNVIHINLIDDTDDAYDVLSVGLFTTIGGVDTLVGIYSQSTAILTKTEENTALFSIDFVLTGVNPGTITVGNTNFAFTQATETVRGAAEIATTAETLAGVDDSRYVTPLKLKQARPIPYHIRASVDLRAASDNLNRTIVGVITWSWTRETLDGGVNWRYVITYPNTQYYIDRCARITTNHWIPFGIGDRLYVGIWRVVSVNHAARQITINVPQAASPSINLGSLSGSFTNTDGGFAIASDATGRILFLSEHYRTYQSHGDGGLQVALLSEEAKIPGTDLYRLYVSTHDNGFGLGALYGGTIKTLGRCVDFFTSRGRNPEIANLNSWNNDNFWFTQYALPVGMNASSRLSHIDISYQTP